MKYLLTILLVTFCHLAHAERPVLTADSSVPIPKLSFDTKGELQITASAASSVSDFDFLVGKWKMHNRKLNKRLEGCQEWTEFESASENSKILSGTADMDTYSTTEMPGQEGKLFEGLTLRLFNPKTRLWSLYWSPAMSAFSTRRSSAHSRMVSGTFLRKTPSRENRSS